MKKIIAVLLVLLSVFVLFSCGEEKDKESSAEESKESIIFPETGNEIVLDNYNTTNPVVVMKVKDYGTIVIELYPDVAPNTVNNFIYLVKSGYYDNNTFHRVDPSLCIIQGGDPTATGSGGPNYKIKGEFSDNGFENNLSHTTGVISMARATGYDTAGGQFFIMTGDFTYFDGKYATFGKVIDGMDVVYEIGKIPYRSLSSGKLTDPLTIEKAAVDTKGVTYPEPEKIQ